MCVITKRKKIRGKLKDKNRVGMMVGYAEDHASGTNCVYMLAYDRVIETRNIQWMNMYHGIWMTAKNGTSSPSEEE